MYIYNHLLLFLFYYIIIYEFSGNWVRDLEHPLFMRQKGCRNPPLAHLCQHPDNRVGVPLRWGIS